MIFMIKFDVIGYTLPRCCYDHVCWKVYEQISVRVGECQKRKALFFIFLNCSSPSQLMVVCSFRMEAQLKVAAKGHISFKGPLASALL